MPIVKKRLDEWKRELAELYSKARTKEEYERLVRMGITYAVTLGSLKESVDTAISTLLDSYWAEYYLLLKYPGEDAEGKNNAFVEKIKSLRGQAEDLVNQAELVYILAVAWSHLLKNQEQADRYNTEMHKLILRGKVPEVLILKWINFRVVDGMDAKNWRGSIEIANEITGFTSNILEKPENIGVAANILNNRGAAKIRGRIDINDGIKDLVSALDYYLRQTPVQLKHIEGIRNRLKEAVNI